MQPQQTKSSFNPAGLADVSFRTLVDNIKDYAIFMVDRGGYIQTWNTGAELINGYLASEIIGQHIGVFYTPGRSGARPHERSAGQPPTATGPRRRRRVAGAQGRLALLGRGQHHRAARSAGRALRLREDHARPDRPPQGRARAAATRRRAAAQRGALSSDHRRGRGLCHLHARPAGARGDLEQRGRAAQGVHGQRDHRPTLRALSHRRRRPRRPLRAGAGPGRPRGAGRERRLAPPQGRLAVLGLRGADGDPKRERRALGVRQGDARPDRPPSAGRRAAAPRARRGGGPSAGRISLHRLARAQDAAHHRADRAAGAAGAGHRRRAPSQAARARGAQRRSVGDPDRIADGRVAARRGWADAQARAASDLLGSWSRSSRTGCARRPSRSAASWGFQPADRFTARGIACDSSRWC